VSVPYANLHYPTPYADQQTSFKGAGNGIRANARWSSNRCNDDQAATVTASPLD
jgi:hypothetical protein